jgi:predicted nucleotide-binding protein (sugar kinase/HSP70/actin superfamily)
LLESEVSLVANEQNLIPQAHKLTVEEASKGGIASGEARRARKTLKEELIALLEMDDNNQRISIALLGRALNGDISAFTTIRDTIGEKPVDKLEAGINSEVNITIELSDD